MVKIVSETLFGLNKACIEELQKIADTDGGALRPERIVDVAKDPKNPLHSKFEWDDSKAAIAHRLAQAGELVRSVKVVFETREEKKITVRNWMWQDGAYRTTKSIMTKKDAREELMEAAMRELEGFARKYAALEELAGVRTTIWDCIKRYKKNRK